MVALALARDLSVVELRIIVLWAYDRLELSALPESGLAWDGNRHRKSYEDGDT